MQMNTLFVFKKGTWNSAAFSVSIGFPLPCFIKIGYDISASTACLSHLFIEHAILEISSIKMIVKIHPAYRTDSNFFWWTTLTDNNRLIWTQKLSWRGKKKQKASSILTTWLLIKPTPMPFNQWEDLSPNFIYIVNSD